MDASFFSCKQILIIDDCAPVRTSIKAMAQQIGFQSIHLARDAAEAIGKCQQTPFDFILSDFNLGEGKDGYQLFETLKAQQLLAPLSCFIMISAENQRQTVHGMIELQPDDYLLKPFTYQQLEQRFISAATAQHLTRLALVADGSTPPPDAANSYQPSACPGGRPPHAWLADGRWFVGPPEARWEST